MHRCIDEIVSDRVQIEAIYETSKHSIGESDVLFRDKDDEDAMLARIYNGRADIGGRSFSIRLCARHQ